MGEKENKASLRRFYDEVFNQKNIDLIDELASPNIVEHEDIAPFPRDINGIKQFFGAFAQAFPDTKATVESMVAEGDKVWARVTMTGTHKGEFLGMPPTGKSFQITAMDELRFDENAKVVEHWGVTDNAGMLQQLGVIEGPPGG